MTLVTLADPRCKTNRKVRHIVSSGLSPLSILGYLAAFRDSLWPGGKLRPQQQQQRSEAERQRLRENALRKLSTLLPEVAAHFVGRDNARRAARRTWALLQNKRLNKHIVYTLIDLVVEDLFPEQNPE